jgi:hypothetical protein
MGGRGGVYGRAYEFACFRSCVGSWYGDDWGFVVAYAGNYVQVKTSRSPVTCGRRISTEMESLLSPRSTSLSKGWGHCTATPGRPHRLIYFRKGVT